MAEVESVSTSELYIREECNGLFQQLPFFLIKYTTFPPLLNGIEQEGVAQGFLQVDTVVCRTVLGCRHGRTLVFEVLGHV